MPSPGTPRPLSAAQARELESAFRLLQAGRADEALAMASRLVVEAAQAPDAQQLLAMCHAGTGNADAAESAFLRALELAPDHPLVLVNHAAFLRKAGKLDAALPVLRRVVGIAPDFARGWSELGAAALEAGHAEQAVAALRRATDLQPDAHLDWHLLGNAAREAGDLDAAEAAFRKVIALAPGQRSAITNLGSVLRLSGRSGEAVACLQSMGADPGAGPELADTLAGALLDAGRPDEALQLAQRTAERYPDFVPGTVTLANLLWEYAPAQDPDEPFQLFRAAIRERPRDRALRSAYINFLFAARSAGEALAQARIARAQADEPVFALMEANALEMLGRTAQAGALYAQLHRSGGSGVPALLNAYTRHLLKAGQWDAAAQRSGEAIRADPENQEAWAYLATAWRLSGDSREDWLCDYERLVGVVEIETPPGFSDRPGFLQALAATLEHLHKARREPIQQSLRGGSQTPGRLFGRHDPVIAAARAALLQGAGRWLATLPADARHPFLKHDARNVRPGGSWSVKLWSSGKHVDHIHPEGWMSSAFYVALPPSVATAPAGAGQAGHLQFGQPPLELGLALPPRRVVRPECGKLVLFPSYLWHGTVPFEDAQPRITIAFDLVPAGRFSERYR